ncbi:MAG: hypothetical protein B6226_03265 [Candidatus Cloacimonetes bacterium 4572_65]|nr:MAG: hypothetical protein B6226_03265 [Candidatus Cloacimonetes bacterium 4572_65]
MWKIVYWAVSTYETLIILAVLKSFMVYFLSNSSFAPMLRKLDILDTVTDPYLNIFRKYIPTFNGFDFSALVGIIVLQIIENAIIKNLM